MTIDTATLFGLYTVFVLGYILRKGFIAETLDQYARAKRDGLDEYE